MPSSFLIKKILTPLHRGDWAHSKYVSICAYCCHFGAQSRWKVTLAAMVFSDDVQLNPDLSINKNGKVRKRKRIEIRRVDKEEEDWMKINLKQAHLSSWTHWWRLDKSLNYGQKVLGSILIYNQYFWISKFCPNDTNNTYTLKEKWMWLPRIELRTLWAKSMHFTTSPFLFLNLKDNLIVLF